jgi:hypothetical protein
MYIYDGDSAKSIAQNPEWYQDSIRVFDGKFTNDDDKKSLVPTIMALWATVLRNRDANQDSVGVYESSSSSIMQTCFQRNSLVS